MMKESEYEKANYLIKHCKEADFEGPKGKGLVEKAEATLGLHFPPSFRRFLMEWGCGSILGPLVSG